jgi:pilus assembly protein CpaC
MKTELGFSSGSHARRRSLSGTVLAAALCAGMAVAQSGAAQEIGGTSAPGKGGANAALPVGRGPVPMMISMSPMPSGPAASGKSVGAVPLSGPSCSGEIRDESSVAVAVGKSVLVPLAEPARNRTLGNPTVAQATLVSPRTLYLVGMTVGTTNMIVQGRSGQCQIIDVIVNIDSDGLQRTLQQLLPAERGIRVSTAAGNLVLAGRVSGAQAAQQAMEIANAYAGAQPTQQQQASTANFGAGGSSLTHERQQGIRSHQHDDGRFPAAGDARSEGRGSLEDAAQPARRGREYPGRFRFMDGRAGEQPACRCR